MKIKTTLICFLFLLLFVTQCFAAEKTETDTPIPKGVYTSLDELADKRIGVQTGSSFDQIAIDSFPNAERVYFSVKTDLINALMTKKIDSLIFDLPIVESMMRENDEITYIPEMVDTFDFGFVFPKTEEGKKLRDEFNEYLAEIKENETFNEFKRNWIVNENNETRTVDYKNLPDINGKLTMATESLYEPFTYRLNGEIVGYDIDMAADFCKKYGYALEIVDMNFEAILPSIISSKCDFAASGLTITKERAESVYFSDSTFSGGTVMVVLRDKQDDPSINTENTPFASIAASFEKTFIRESRWKLFLEGILNTLLITVLSAFFGTVLGFLLFLLCRRGNKIANTTVSFLSWLLQGMPTVVFLMILFYVVFGKVAISGTIVSIIGFTLTVAVAIYQLIKMGVGTIDRGQYEAAYALGYSENRTFFRIILPQVISIIAPSYQSELVSLIKATSIVGYIAVQDLTKMGDIVRSRTYEAFFPLIAVTIIYFLLETLLTFAVKRIQIKTDPKKRKREEILKGVSTND